MYTDKNLGEQLLTTLDACNAQIQAAFTELLEPYNLTLVEYQALLILWKEDGLASKQLARKLGKEGSSITPLVVSLERKQFILRRENPKDARSACVFLTEKGKNTRIPARTLDGQLLACLQHSGALQEADLYTLLRLLDKALISLRT
ncbi:Organic hydroperoxide resistance transcriptional regulator [bioreactor metagenome]|uniref:Organic hydroperoxide resistance transcriptional regulator n=1 Tax=bioreactor metagenome TaxID=1076179 RepID=A0A644YMZ0_9ZZZZ